MTTSTGAPPDYFDKNGQNWGFPTHNWEEMSKDNYAWWRARLTQMSKYFTAYRIDHILGFFRIWELPEHAVTGLVGKFRSSIALSQEELKKEGIWDFDRRCCPYIRQEMLQFKEDCNTEKKIVSKLKECGGKSWLESEDNLRNELFDLIKNVVLIRDPEDARKFYPRFSLEDTSNLQALDDHSKNVQKRLYHDYYFQRQETLWSENAMKTLPALLNSSDMLTCGEDLGLIPNCVHPVLQDLGLLGLRIQRMPSESGVEFGIPSQYSHMTVCAPSCHDCSTMRACAVNVGNFPALGFVSSERRTHKITTRGRGNYQSSNESKTLLETRGRGNYQSSNESKTLLEIPCTCIIRNFDE
ncbi:hypothetical protein MKW98_026543 [Papaver atlanticum]|uniref:4-alpha-glucanotransferase n=1 Tax=Papaver atlanticum TaxID=357466 RepID=A0AAD4XVC4_9MAGN|nr:hypothetical protein MKW98_026543 [Papaver atlanticum]